MKKKIRLNVFESNSSSTHSLTITTLEKYRKWESGELLYDRWSDEFVEAKDNKKTFSIEDVMDYYDETKERYWKDWEQLTSSEKQEFVNRYKDERLDEDEDEDEQFMTFDRWSHYYGYDYETYEEIFESPSGDKMVAFGYYGYN